MKRPDLLTEEQIEIKLSDLDFWVKKDNSIEREIVVQNFVAAVGVVNSIAIFAEILDHHPDILIYAWNKVRITTSTHDKGGLTELDFELAKKIETLKL
ncbi:MAG: 4a-hydroxytetrahydrobiopterin dehydratase [Candidatus Kapaibacteriota bacterium]|jgi:4a-hydroxytetrahydrobiopterin dehydratase